jgi:hypothetical protein
LTRDLSAHRKPAVDGEIMQQRSEAAAANLARELGDRPLRALMATAQRP